MRALYTVCYPDISSGDRAFIEGFRRQHDLPYRDVIAAHFTLAFGVREVADSRYIEHVRAVGSQSTEISFTCRYAMLGADDADETAYVFLVPDEGFSAISLLHDRLYTGALEPFHRLDIPYVPHVTMASLNDRAEAKGLCTELNRRGLCIDGVLRSLTVGVLEAGAFRDLTRIDLRAA